MRRGRWVPVAVICPKVCRGTPDRSRGAHAGHHTSRWSVTLRLPATTGTHHLDRPPHRRKRQPTAAGPDRAPATRPCCSRPKEPHHGCHQRPRPQRRTRRHHHRRHPRPPPRPHPPTHPAHRHRRRPTRRPRHPHRPDRTRPQRLPPPPSPLEQLTIAVTDHLELLPIGTRTDTTYNTHIYGLITGGLDHYDTVIIDTGATPAWHHHGHQRILVTRPCYLALRRTIGQHPPTHTVAITEPGRVIDTDDITAILGTPVTTTIPHDPPSPEPSTPACSPAASHDNSPDPSQPSSTPPPR